MTYWLSWNELEIEYVCFVKTEQIVNFKHFMTLKTYKNAYNEHLKLDFKHFMTTK